MHEEPHQSRRRGLLTKAMRKLCAVIPDAALDRSLTSPNEKRRPARRGGDGAGRRVPGFGEETPGIRNVGVSPETEFANIVAIVPILRRFSELPDEVIE